MGSDVKALCTISQRLLAKPLLQRFGALAGAGLELRGHIEGAAPASAVHTHPVSQTASPIPGVHVLATATTWLQAGNSHAQHKTPRIPAKMLAEPCWQYGFEACAPPGLTRCQ